MPIWLPAYWPGVGISPWLCCFPYEIQFPGRLIQTNQCTVLIRCIMHAKAKVCQSFSVAKDQLLCLW